LRDVKFGQPAIAAIPAAGVNTCNLREKPAPSETGERWR
jgi:hypothetical protein